MATVSGAAVSPAAPCEEAAGAEAAGVLAAELALAAEPALWPQAAIDAARARARVNDASFFMVFSFLTGQ